LLVVVSFSTLFGIIWLVYLKDKLKELDDVFMTLPESTLSLLPTPKAFRKLNNGVQAQIRHVYYRFFLVLFM
jgi:hypothetical protein